MMMFEPDDTTAEDLAIERLSGIETLRDIWPTLTSRQVECWLLRMLGLTQAETGDVLGGITKQAVSLHLRGIWEKLGK